MRRKLSRASAVFSLLLQYLSLVWGYLQAIAASAQTKQDDVLESLPGQMSLSAADKVAIFVHFDRAGLIHDYVIVYLEAIRRAGFEVVFVSNGPKLTPASIKRLAPLCATMLFRPNIGYDFGAYRDGLRFLGDLARFRSVLLANDSVYGPLFDLAAIISQCDGERDIWGMTDSWSGRYHLQSYFLLIGREVLTSEAFRKFWEPSVRVNSKQWIIHRYEIGFTQAMIRAGYKCLPLFPYHLASSGLVRANRDAAFSSERLGKKVGAFFEEIVGAVERGAPLNPLHHFWDHMIVQLRYPFIKRELLARNPARIPHAYLWAAAISSVSDYDCSLIAQHLQVVTRNRVP